MFTCRLFFVCMYQSNIALSHRNWQSNFNHNKLFKLILINLDIFFLLLLLTIWRFFFYIVQGFIDSQRVRNGNNLWITMAAAATKDAQAVISIGSLPVRLRVTGLLMRPVKAESDSLLLWWSEWTNHPAFKWRWPSFFTLKGSLWKPQRRHSAWPLTL